MKFGEWKVTHCLAGRFGLDGGAMFGVVPKTMWERGLPPDKYNRVPMVMRVLLVQGHGKTVIVDVGSGTGYGEKMKQIYIFEETDHLRDAVRKAGVDPESITDVMLTHLHFDHGAGAAEPHGDKWRLVFPRARHHVQKSQWEHALNPNPRDKASYFEERIGLLESEGVLELHDGPWSLGPGFDMHVFNGHTPGQQLPLISGPEGRLFFCGDLFPFHHHVPPAWVMSYDLYPVTAMEEKTRILERAAAEDWLFFFEHDAQVESCRIVRDGKRFAVVQPVSAG